MCRFVAYRGPRIHLADLITSPNHGLVKQSYHSRERTEPLNGDGFGVGWYVPGHGPDPCLFTSLTPAWADRNLYRLSHALSSSCIFAHIRAATKGFSVSELNCHPFQFGRILWMHNGNIPDFFRIKRKLRNSLPDLYYHMIQGTTDSEHSFGLFLSFLQKEHRGPMLTRLKRAMFATLRQLKEWCEEEDLKEHSALNFAVTDGKNIVVSRYATWPKARPESLYYTHGEKFICEQGIASIVNPESAKNCVLIASEPLTKVKDYWSPVPENSLLTVDPQYKLNIQPIEF